MKEHVVYIAISCAQIARGKEKHRRKHYWDSKKEVMKSKFGISTANRNIKKVKLSQIKNYNNKVKIRIVG